MNKLKIIEQELEKEIKELEKNWKTPREDSNSGISISIFCMLCMNSVNEISFINIVAINHTCCAVIHSKKVL